MRGGEMGSLGIQIVKGRWFMVFASFLIMSAAGATYMFGLYSSEIKESLGYDQTTLNLLSFFKDLGSNVGVLSGLMAEVMPPWFVLSIGSLLNFSGYFMIWLGVSKRISRPSVWQMCLYMCIGANSQTFANTTALATSVKNFPESRGVVLGLLKGFLGLSGAIITQMYLAINGHDNQSLILLIACLPTILSLLFVRTVRIVKVVQPQPNVDDLSVFYHLLYMSLALAGFLLLIIILEKTVPFSRPEYVASAAVVLLLLFLPLAVVIRQEYNIWKNKYHPPSALQTKVLDSRVRTPDHASSTSTTEESEQASSSSSSSSCFRTAFQQPNRGEDYTILQALFSIDMLTLFLATICGVGGTLTAIDNLGQIGESLGYPTKSIGTFVSLVSIWNYLGRVSAGFGSEYLLNKYKFPRPLMLTLTLLLSCVGHLLIAFGVPNSLYFASVVMGFCFGAQWPLLFAIISEIFGLKYFSTLFNLGAVASPVGSYILSVKVAGNLYDREAERQMIKASSFILGHHDQEDLMKSCIGVECYKMAFLIITGATVFGVLVSVILVVRTRSFYAGDIYNNFREEDAMDRTA